MTSIFAFPLENAWVIVADKLETNISKAMRAKGGYEVFPASLIKKLFIYKNLVFGFAGESRHIEIIQNIFKSKINEKLEFKKAMSEIKEIYGDSLREIDVEILLLDPLTLKAYKLIINQAESVNLKDYEITDIEDGVVGSGSFHFKIRGQILLSSLKEFRSLTLKRKVEDIIRESVNVLNNVSLFDFPYTGNPYVYGCDIAIIKKNKIDIYEIIPNGYLFKSKKMRNWKKISRGMR
jgi:hypothetical protein